MAIAKDQIRQLEKEFDIHSTLEIDNKIYISNSNQKVFFKQRHRKIYSLNNTYIL